MFIPNVTCATFSFTPRSFTIWWGVKQYTSSGFFCWRKRFSHIL